MINLQELYDAILKGDNKSAVAAMKVAIEEKCSPTDVVLNYMIPAMDEVGRRFACEEYFVPEMLLSARAMKGALALIQPLLTAGGAKPRGRVVIGTVKGDLHDIGKNLVGVMLEGAGFQVADLGTDVPPEKFVAAALDEKTDIVCLSALLTVTMPAMKTVIDALSTAGIRDKVKVMVGGAPVTQQFADEIGADAYGQDASVAVALARQFLN